MNVDAIREVLNRRPFDPFEIVMTSGERYVIRHPEFLMLLRSQAVVGDPATDRASFLSLPHVSELRPVQTQGSS